MAEERPMREYGGLRYKTIPRADGRWDVEVWRIERSLAPLYLGTASSERDAERLAEGWIDDRRAR